MENTVELNKNVKPVITTSSSFQKKKRSNTLTSMNSNTKVKKSVTFSEYDTVITPKLISLDSDQDEEYFDDDSSDYEEGESDHYELTENGEVVLIKRKKNRGEQIKKNNGRRFSIGSLKDTLFNRNKKNKNGRHVHKCKTNNGLKKRAFSFKNAIFSIDYKMTDPNSLVRLNKTWKVFPFHLFPILKYAFIDTNYNLVKSLQVLIPCQIIYLLFQVIPNTNYGYTSTIHTTAVKTNSLGSRNSSNNIKRRKKMKTMKPNIIILLQCLILMPIVSLLLTFFITICGGPLKNFKETFYLSCHINTISLPMGYTLINCNFKQVNLKKYYIIVLLGTWLGCFVIPLDWDREWQIWPTSLVVGAYIAGIIAYGLGIYI